MHKDTVADEVSEPRPVHRTRETDRQGGLRASILTSGLVVGIGLIVAASYLIGARVGFDQGKEQAVLAQQELRIRQILFAQWALTNDDFDEAADRMNGLLKMYLEDRLDLFEKEPFWLASHLFEAYPLHEHIPGQTDAMIFDHLTTLREERDSGSMAAEHSSSPPLLEDAYDSYLKSFDAILIHTAAQYDAVLKQELSVSGNPHHLLLHDHVDGPIKHQIDYQEGMVEFRFLGDASIGNGGVLWAEIEVSDGATGYIAIGPGGGGVLRLRVPFWRRLLAALPGY